LEEGYKRANILIVAPKQERVALRSILGAIGYERLETCEDPTDAVSAYDRVKPDLVLIDVGAPGGFETLELLNDRVPTDDVVPLLAVAAGTDSSTRLRSLGKGAKDFLAKPLEETEVLTRVSNLLENRFLQLERLGDRASRLESLADDIARARTRSLEEVQVELLERFARTVEYQGIADPGHRERVAGLARLLALEMGFTPERADLVGRAALLHDIGNVGIPESIWSKPGELTDEERQKVREHTSIGAELLSKSKSPLLWLAEEIAHTHHERWDGNGYLGLAGEAIPIAGRLVSVADAFDALTHDRPYRPARTPYEACEELKRESGHQFDPRVVDAFLAVYESDDFAELYRRPGD